MTESERIKALRSEFDLTQAQFAERIGMVQASLSAIETGIRSLTDKTVKVICSEFHVREEWLRNGTGEMFEQTSTNTVHRLAEEYRLSPIGEALIDAYSHADENERQAVDGFLMDLLDKVQSPEYYERFRKQYIEKNAQPFAAYNGNTEGMKEIVQAYEKAPREDTGKNNSRGGKNGGK